MEPFSVRMGIIRANESVQTHDMDDRLRNGLWTAFVTFFARGAQLTDSRSASYPDVEIWLRLLWTEFFGLTVDSMDVNDKRTLDSIRYQYKELPWFKVYDFIELMAEHSKDDEFVKECNRVLERDRSAFRFTGHQLVKITDERDLAAVQRALDDTTTGKLALVRHHLETAVQLFSDRTDPDYRNSIKESVSAVEGVVNLINGGKPGTLGDAVKKLDPRLHPAFEDGVKKLYGWTSDDKSGIRHALMDEPNVGYEEAQFMLVLSSGFVSFLVARAAKAGVL